MSEQNTAERKGETWDLDQYEDVADWSKLKKKDLIDMLGDDVFGLYGIISICDLEILEDDPQIKTACITLTHNPKIFINRKFLSKFCVTPHHIFMVIMHELYHHILNHARVFKSSNPQEGPLLNIATDALINALLAQLYPDNKHTSFFRNLYETQIKEQQQKEPGYSGFPFTLLKSRSRHNDLRIRYFYNQLYSPFGQDLDSVVKLLKESAPIQYISQVSERALGDHSGNNSALDEHARKELMKHIKKANKTLEDKFEEHKRMLEARKKAEEEAKKKQSEAKGKKGSEEEGEGDQGSKSILPPEKREKNQDCTPESSAFTKYLADVIDFLEKQNDSVNTCLIKMARQSVVSKVIVETKKMFPKIPLYTPQPNFKEKARTLSFILGRFRPYDKNPKKPQDTGLCHVYIDVSGSMGNYVDEIYKILQGLKDYLDPTIHLFSTEIKDITKREFCRNVIETTWGTDFDCIFEHMTRKNIRKAVIFTDGYANLSSHWEKEMKAKKTQVITVFTPDRQDTNPLMGVSKAAFTFNEKMRLDKDKA